MIYKEWRELRSRFFLVLVVYAIFTALAVTVWSQANCNYWPERNMCWVGERSAVDYVPTFRNWLTASFFINLIVGLLFGVDSIAEENGQGTLGFLLSRPISRPQIYYQKLSLRLLAVASLSFVSNLVVFLFDQFSARPTPLMEALSLFALLILVGLLTLCLGSLVSVFSKNTLESLLYTFLIIIGLYSNLGLLFFGGLGFYLRQLNRKFISLLIILLLIALYTYLILSKIYLPTTLYTTKINLQSGWLNLLIAGILAILTFGCGWAGLFFFKRREY